MIPHIWSLPQQRALGAQRLSIDTTTNLMGGERGRFEAQLGQLLRNAREDDRVLLALRLQLCVTSADELVNVEPQHVEHLIDRARRLLLGKTKQCSQAMFSVFDPDTHPPDSGTPSAARSNLLPGIGQATRIFRQSEAAAGQPSGRHDLTPGRVLS